MESTCRWAWCFRRPRSGPIRSVSATTPRPPRAWATAPGRLRPRARRRSGGHRGLVRPLHRPARMFHEPFVLFGYLAAVTPTLELVTGVIILPQRQTALVAKQAAEVDVLSGGKLRLGVGIGWNYVEYEGARDGLQEPGPALRGADRAACGSCGRSRSSPTRARTTRSPRRDQPAARSSARSRSGSAGRPSRPSSAPPRWRTASSLSARSKGGWPATLEKIRGWREAAGLDWATFGIEARINAGTGTPDDWRATSRSGRRWAPRTSRSTR